MRTRTIIFVSVVAAGLAACGSNSHRRDAAAREAGRDAYHFTQGAKKAAKEIGKDLHKAGEQARQGWNEAKQNDRTRHPDK